MNDAIVPSYRVRPQEDGPSWRLPAIAGGVAAVFALGGAAWWGATHLGPGGPETVPVIEPDPRPVKVRPRDPGGLRVAYQDEFIYDRNAVERAFPSGEVRLAPGPERPALDQLRAQIAPPPAVMAPAAPAVPAARGSPEAAAPAAAEGEAASRLAASRLAAAVPAGGDPSPAASAAAPTPDDAGGGAAAVASAAAPPPSAGPENASFAPTPGGRVQVQLGALVSEEAARTEWERLMRRMPEMLGPFRPQILRFDRGEGAPPMWRLRIGGFADGTVARAFCEQARGRGAACAVVGG